MNVTDDILFMNSKYEFIQFDVAQLESYYEITQLDKPLYSLTYYTVPDLIDICNKLNLPHDNMKKQNIGTGNELGNKLSNKLGNTVNNTTWKQHWKHIQNRKPN
jgi:hypothetical protein